MLLSSASVVLPPMQKGTASRKSLTKRPLLFILRADIYGKIFVYNVTRVVKIRTGEEDFAALQDVE